MKSDSSALFGLRGAHGGCRAKQQTPHRSGGCRDIAGPHSVLEPRHQIPWSMVGVWDPQLASRMVAVLLSRLRVQPKRHLADRGAREDSKVIAVSGH